MNKNQDLFKQKYIKYKSKYMSGNQKGGALPDETDETRNNVFVSESTIKLGDLEAMMDPVILGSLCTSITQLDELQSSRRRIAVHKAVQAYEILKQKKPKLNFVMVEDTTIAYSKNFVDMDNTEAYPGANTKLHIKAYKQKLEQVIRLVDGYEEGQTKVWYTSAIAVAYNSNPADVIYVENTVRGHFNAFNKDDKTLKGLIDPQFVPEEAEAESGGVPRNNALDVVLASEQLKKERAIWHPRGGAFRKIAHILKERGLVLCIGAASCAKEEE
jgi:hypothetical protein